MPSISEFVRQEEERLGQCSLWQARFLAARLTLRVIAEDEALACGCGEEPYTDGDLCPRCFAITMLEKLQTEGHDPVAELTAERDRLRAQVESLTTKALELWDSYDSDSSVDFLGSGVADSIKEAFGLESPPGPSS